MEVLQYLNQSGCADRTVKELLTYIRRLSFDGSYKFATETEAPTEPAESVEPAEPQEEEWIAGGDEFEKSTPFILIF